MVVPAKVEGTWRRRKATSSSRRSIQKLSGTLGSTKIEGKMNGDEITFTAGKTTYTGRVNGNTIQGTAAAAGPP